jgi:hypothetical protein
MRRTLLTAGVFALLAMIYVPTPRHGYRFIFAQEDTSIAFFQLLLNVGFAALLGAILATIMPKIVTGVLRLPKWVWRGIGGIALIALLSVGAVARWNFREAAQGDERYANELLQRRHDVFEAEMYFRNAARNWRLALRFDEATRIENRIKGLQQHPAQKDWQSTDNSWLSKYPTVDQAPQAPAQAPQASGQSATETGPWEDYRVTPVPRARPVRSPSPR